MISSKGFWLAAMGSLCAASIVAFAAESVSNTLTVNRIVSNDAGAEIRDSASTGKPGDLLEYVASFHNAGASTARGLTATLPLPVGTEFVSGSQQPLSAQASLDGSTFASLPLKHLVKAADGGLHEELVPTREYRYLRWSATDLAAHGDLIVSARVRIASASATNADRTH